MVPLAPTALGLFEGSPPLLTLPGGPAPPHDLRRTLRTGLGRLRVAIHVAERCLNHSLGRLAKVYDVGDYLDERREALERWDGFVQGLLDSKAAKVVPLQVEGAGSVLRS